MRIKGIMSHADLVLDLLISGYTENVGRGIIWGRVQESSGRVIESTIALCISFPFELLAKLPLRR